MGLVNVRNLKKAKQLLDKNRHRVGDVVGKAGEQLDKASKGKTANVTSKAAGAARKYSAGGVTHHGIDSPVDQPADSEALETSPQDARVRQAQANAGAATAVKGAADALTNLLNKAAAKAEATNTAAKASTESTESTDPA